MVVVQGISLSPARRDRLIRLAERVPVWRPERRFSRQNRVYLSYCSCVARVAWFLRHGDASHPERLQAGQGQGTASRSIRGPPGGEHDEADGGWVMVRASMGGAARRREGLAAGLSSPGSESIDELDTLSL